MQANPDLQRELAEINYNKYRRSFTPKKSMLLCAILGLHIHLLNVISLNNNWLSCANNSTSYLNNSICYVDICNGYVVFNI